MKPTASRLLILAPLGLLSLLQAETFSPESRVTAVTVHPNLALVTREAEVKVTPGEHEIVFFPLPDSLDENSLQVEGAGAKAVILDVQTRRKVMGETSRDKVREVEASLQKVEASLRELADKGRVIEIQQKMLDEFRTVQTQQPKDGQVARPSADEWLKLMNFQTEQLAKSQEQRRLLDQQVKLTEKEKGRLLDELKKLGGNGREVRIATVRVRADEAGTLKVGIRYSLRGASWTPTYDARLQQGGEKPAIDWSSFALVRQQSGEEWKDVKLTLSTSRPQSQAGSPELDPWVLNVAQPSRAYSYAPGSSLALPGSVNLGGMRLTGSNEAALALNNNAMALADAPAPVAMETSFVGVEAGAVNVVFNVPGTVSLAADGTQQRIALGRAVWEAKLQHQVTPKLDETAYLSAYLNNQGEAPLLPGLVRTFVDGSLMATTPLKVVQPGERFQLPLGADDSVKVKRKLLNRLEEDKGLTGGTRRHNFDYEIEVAYNRKAPGRVVVFEQMPQVSDEKIVVRPLSPQKAEEGVAFEEQGRVVWRLDFKPGEKRKLSLRFSVEHPKDMVINGLP